MRRATLVLLALLLAGCAGEPSAPTGATPTVSGTPAATMTPAVTPAASPAPQEATPSPATPTPQQQQPPQERFTGCSGEGPVTFANAPMRPEDYVSILPYGLVVGAHVTPIDHMYFAPTRDSPRDAFEVRAIADGVIYEVQPRDINVDAGGAAKAREWRMDIAHTCTFTSYFDLLTSITPEIEKAYNETRRAPGFPWRGIPVNAGQLVGRIGAQTLDFGVYDYNVTLPGFIVPEHYGHETWKVHTVDPYPYFPEDIRDTLLAKTLRQVEPRAGKIDHDVDGRLIGNWFKVGTNGYAGLNQSYYWEGHLAIAPDAFDPTRIFLSIGNWSGKAAQFGFKGNSLDPANVTPESGALELELLRYQIHDAKTGQTGDRITVGNPLVAREEPTVLGTVLIQMTGPRALKLETFPGKTASQVSGFTSNAWEYER